MVKATYFKLHPLRQGLVVAYREEAKRIIEHMTQPVIGVVSSKYEQTFYKWRGRYDPAILNKDNYTPSGIEYPNVDVKFETEIIVSKNGVRILIHSVVVDNSGQPHFLWYMIDQGTKAKTFERDSVIFPIRSQNRTQPNTLSVRNEPQYGGFVQIAAGEKRQGIEPRRWSREIALQTRREIIDTLYKRGWKLEYKITSPL